MQPGSNLVYGANGQPMQMSGPLDINSTNSAFLPSQNQPILMPAGENMQAMQSAPMAMGPGVMGPPAMGPAATGPGAMGPPAMGPAGAYPQTNGGMM